MSAIASQITSLTIVYSTVYSGAYKRKHQSSASQAFVWGIHWWPVHFPHKRPVTRKMFPFDNVIMCIYYRSNNECYIHQSWCSVIRCYINLCIMPVLYVNVIFFSSPIGAAFMRKCIRSAMFQVHVMAWRLFGGKPLPEPILIYRQLDP